MENNYDEEKIIDSLRDYYRQKQAAQVWDALFADIRQMRDACCRAGFSENFADSVAYNISVQTILNIMMSSISVQVTENDIKK